MTAIKWDTFGERTYESGLDRGVLYLPDGRGVPWNGLTNVAESVSGAQTSEYYYDGVKYSILSSPGEYSASLKAFTYPDEFLQFEGVQAVRNGLSVTNQPTARFGLSYRTRVGSDDEGLAAYKIHVLYNLSATPSTKTYSSWSASQSQPMEFEWEINAIPGEVPGFKPTAHLIFDTRQMSELLVRDIEDTLYGTTLLDANQPPISTLVSFVGDWVIIRITENLDGTWIAEGPDNLITMIDSTTFQIIQANAVYLDANTYAISNLTY